MGRLLSSFFRSRKRPVITQEESTAPKQVNDVVDWFVTNEAGIRRHTSSVVLNALLLLGYSARDTTGSRAVLEYRDGHESCGLRNQTTFYIWRQLKTIRDANHRIAEHQMSALLSAIADNLKNTVIHLRAYDRTGEELDECLRLASPLATAFIQQPNALERVSEFRAKFEHEVLNEQRRRHLIAIVLAKYFSEVTFYVLCWLYYSWYGQQFYSAPLEDE